MSYTFLQEQGEEFSAASFLDIPASVLSRLNLTAGESCSSDNAMASCQGSQSGMTCEPSTVNHGGDSLTLCAEGSRARTFPPRAADQESKESEAAFGGISDGWFAKWDPDSSGWKTRQCSLLAGLDEFSETWPQWGMMQNGVCWERTMWALPIVESASGYWPTPDTCGGGTGPSQLNRNQPRLQDVVKWPTPQSRDWKDTARKSSLDALMAGHQQTLGRVVHKWATPCAADNRDRGNLGMPAIQRRIVMGKQINLSMSVSDTSGALNPDWVEWLMGWPIGQTDLKPLETARFQAWLRSHGIH